MAPFTREQSRCFDSNAMEKYGISGLVLMENAGIGVVETMKTIGISGPITICCGKGNNGGDGYVIARQLLTRGCDVRLWRFAAFGESASNAETNRKIIENLGLPIHFFANDPADAENSEQFQRDLSESDWIVDALLGTGAAGVPRSPIRDGIERINRARRETQTDVKVLAVDIPSGLDCDTGQPGEPTIRADMTCTFVAEKIGFTAAEARPFLGCIHVINIGIPH